MRAHAITLLLFTAASAHAQAPPTNPQPVPSSQATVRCAPIQPPNAAEQGRGAPPGQTTGQSREPLSDRLAQADGVMCPPSNIDPQMHKDAPDGGRTPVLPPPGSPGGDPSLRPK
jgi:hypothetical protein